MLSDCKFAWDLWGLVLDLFAMSWVCHRDVVAVMLAWWNIAMRVDGRNRSLTASSFVLHGTFV